MATRPFDDLVSDERATIGGNYPQNGTGRHAGPMQIQINRLFVSRQDGKCPGDVHARLGGVGERVVARQPPARRAAAVAIAAAGHAQLGRQTQPAGAGLRQLSLDVAA